MQPERKPTVFETRVYGLVEMIPRGKVSTYGDIARQLGLRSPRAIGQALKRNPFAPQVPCHRVVSSTGKIGGFYGESTGPRINEKESLLRSEGVAFTDDRVDLATALYHW